MWVTSELNIDFLSYIQVYCNGSNIVSVVVVTDGYFVELLNIYNAQFVVFEMWYYQYWLTPPAVWSWVGHKLHSNLY